MAAAAPPGLRGGAGRAAGLVGTAAAAAGRTSAVGVAVGVCGAGTGSSGLASSDRGVRVAAGAAGGSETPERGGAEDELGRADASARSGAAVRTAARTRPAAAHFPVEAGSGPEAPRAGPDGETASLRAEGRCDAVAAGRATAAEAEAGSAVAARGSGVAVPDGVAEAPAVLSGEADHRWGGALVAVVPVGTAGVGASAAVSLAAATSAAPSMKDGSGTADSGPR